MGPTDSQRHRLQKVSGSALKGTCLMLLAFLSLAGSAEAQITPFRGTLEYQVASGDWPKLVVKAANGSAAYEIALEPDKNADGTISHIDLVLRRPGSPRYTNFLEPPYRWHGLQPYMFNACDFTSGTDCSGYEPTRSIQIKNRKLIVKFSVTKADIQPVPDHAPEAPSDYIFKDLALDVQVDNLK